MQHVPGLPNLKTNSVRAARFMQGLCRIQPSHPLTISDDRWTACTFPLSSLPGLRSALATFPPLDITRELTQFIKAGSLGDFRCRSRGGRTVRYIASRMTFEFTMIDAKAHVVGCEISSAAMDELARTRGTMPADREAQFFALAGPDRANSV